jgi:ABC-type transport system involved in multi-copper enzyme maturation permease subunit
MHVNQLGILNQTSQPAAFGGAFRYEFMMQLRRPALWIGALLLCPFLFNHFNAFYLPPNGPPTVEQSVTQWMSFNALFYPIIAGLLIADRYARDRKTRTEELFHTMPTTVGTRLFGKYLGSVLATLVPLFLVYMVGVALILANWHTIGVLPMALALFAALMLPAVLFVGAFSIACPTFMWTVLYQVLFVCYWFWGNFLNPKIGIPTLNGTLLTPSGVHISRSFFPLGVPSYRGFSFAPEPLTNGFASLGLLLGCALIALFAAWGIVRWQRDQA